MVGVRRLTWGGSSMDSETAGNPMEIWSCSLHCFVEATADPTATWLANAAALIRTLHTSVGAQIDETERLDWAKASDIDVTTGHELDDPVPQILYGTPNRGGGGPVRNPFSTAMRISIDDGTRDRRAKGGFYLPRSAAETKMDGRVSTADVVAIAEAAQDFLSGLNALTGTTVGVWSRVGASFTPSSRLRVGDVPDNISRRRNALRENYDTLPI